LKAPFQKVKNEAALFTKKLRCYFLTKNQETRFSEKAKSALPRKQNKLHFLSCNGRKKASGSPINYSLVPLGTPCASKGCWLCPSGAQPALTGAKRRKLSAEGWLRGSKLAVLFRLLRVTIPSTAVRQSPFPYK